MYRKEHVIPGEKVALALFLTYRRISDGMGTWDWFTDRSDIAYDLTSLHDLVGELSPLPNGAVATSSLRPIQAAIEDAAGRLLAADEGDGLAREYVVTRKAEPGQTMA